MSKVFFDISMSLDGFITAANRRPEEPMGAGGERLHQWAFGEEERNRQLLADAVSTLGAVITGRRNYDDSIPWWGADGPTGPARRPVFVVTHHTPANMPAGGVYTFVTGGIEQAIQQAKAVAGDKDVTIMGGADIGQQYPPHHRRRLAYRISQNHCSPGAHGGRCRPSGRPGARYAGDCIATVAHRGDSPKTRSMADEYRQTPCH